MAAQLLRVVSQLDSRLMPSTFEHAHAPDVPADLSVDTTIRSPEAFCLALKAARERRGIALSEIAKATKVCVSHFAALERHDLRGWPKGLFRRASFRGYVEMIGLPVAETVEEFVRLFPDHEAATPIARPAADAGGLRLSFDPSWHGPRRSMAWRVVTAIVDAGAVLGLAAALAWLAGTHAGTTLAIVSVSYFTLATVLLGDSPMASLIRWLRHDAANLFESAGEDSSVESAEFEQRIWTTDAHRVRPREAPPRLRVRFKLP